MKLNKKINNRLFNFLIVMNTDNINNIIAKYIKI